VRAWGEPLASVGEFGLIERLRRLVPTKAPGVVLGIGDDAAVLRFIGSAVATCDIQVEGVHFTWSTCSPEDVGWRAIAVNLSDVAAMGGTPRFALVSLALPADSPLERIEGIYRGVGEIATSYAIAIAGGNISGTSGPMVIDVTALGDVERAVPRSGAVPGHGVWITGSVGKAAAGRFLLQHPEVHVAGAEALVEAYRRPAPRVAAGKLLAETGMVSAMLDTSDGTASDLLHLVEASDVGVRLDEEHLPVSAGLTAVARAARQDPAAWTLDGGEDYELLFAAAPGFAAEAAQIASRLEVALTRIGEILPRSEGRWVIEPGGARRRLSARGWNHFPAGGDGFGSPEGAHNRRI
jgi:thiamine-monophosphate kinase